MICDVCQSDRLAKNDLGFLVCDDCGAQSFAATQEESEFLMGETGARALQRTRKIKPYERSTKNAIAPLSLILKAIQAALFVQCCSVSNHFGVKLSLLLKTAGDIFLAYFESVRRDYDGKFEIILTGPGLSHGAQATGRLPQFKVQHFITIDILALALNLMGEAITPLDLYIQIRFGNIPTQDVPKLLPPEISMKLTVRLYQFLAQRLSYVTPESITKEMKLIHERVCRVTTLPELRSVSGNVPLSITRYVLQLQLPIETVAPLAQGLLVLYMKRSSTISKPHAIAVIILAVKLLYGSRSPSTLDAILNSSSFAPISKLCTAPDADCADFTAIRNFTRSFYDFTVYSLRTKLAVSDAFDEIYAIPPPEEVWDPADYQMTRAYDDFLIRDEERCLCWYEDPARGGKQKPFNVNWHCFLKTGGNGPGVPEYRRLIYYVPDEMHLGHCIEHYLHRRLFQIASDIYDVAQRDLDYAYRHIVESIYKQYPGGLVRRTESRRDAKNEQASRSNCRRSKTKCAGTRKERKRLKALLADRIETSHNSFMPLETLRSLAAQQRYLESCMASLYTGS